tara:strand:- start:34 stop:1074 length:1041 start_codon:yes stop_codon:yes gene_type:complete
MAYTTIDKPTDYFNTILYSGTGSENSLTVGFQPDWVWIKQRNGTTNQMLTDSVRGATKTLHAQNGDQESTDAQALKSFDSNGFTVGTDTDVNGAGGTGGTYVAWNWLAGGTASSNSNGSITSSVSANTTAGFSIVSFTGSGSNATVGHGLGAVPKMFILKVRTQGDRWVVYHDSLGNGNYISLDRTNAAIDQTDQFNDTSPTNSVFSLGNSGQTNGVGETFIAYCFAEKKGFSKFSSYQGSGNSDGPYIHLGFKPAWIMTKRTDSSSGGEWNILDNKRDTFNVADAKLEANNGDAEETDEMYDILSNGFKITRGDGNINASGGTYIFMAFAESPFVNSNGVPTNAR